MEKTKRKTYEWEELSKLIYEISKNHIEGHITKKDAEDNITNLGVVEGSSIQYLNTVLSLFNGKNFTSNVNYELIEYTIDEIWDEDGKEGLKKALTALDGYIKYASKPKDKNANLGRYRKKEKRLFNKYRKILGKYEELEEKHVEIKTYKEGAKKLRISMRRERSKGASDECIRIHGLVCKSCDYDPVPLLGKKKGRTTIEAHHLYEIKNGERDTNPETDMIPVCVRCHKELHSVEPPLTIEELKDKRKKLELESKNKPKLNL